jgi:hypothetical protein
MLSRGEYKETENGLPHKKTGSVSMSGLSTYTTISILLIFLPVALLLLDFTEMLPNILSLV